MQSVKEDTQGGIVSFIDKQLEGVDGNKRTVSFYQFDTEFEKVHDFDLLRKARSYKFVPRGGTALLDAVGNAITEVGAKLADLPENRRPGYVMVLIVTDGLENSSKEYKKSQVKEMITHQQDKYGWKFTYLGANQDAFAEASSIGISAQSTINFAATSRGVRNTYDVLAGTVSTSSGIVYDSFQREAAVQK
jgi:hypothetical protein